MLSTNRDEAMRQLSLEMRSMMFGLKLREVFGDNDEAADAAMMKMADEIKPSLKLTGRDFAANFLLWQKDVGEEVASQLKNNPNIQGIVDQWVDDCKTSNTEAIIDAFWNMIPEDKRENVTRLDAACFVSENIL